MFRTTKTKNDEKQIITIPPLVKTPTLKLSHFSLLKDLGISSLHLYKNGRRVTNKDLCENLRKELKELVKGMKATDAVNVEDKLERRVSDLLDKHSVMGLFHYPTMRIDSQQRKLLSDIREKQTQIDAKILLLENNKLGVKLKDKQQTEKKFREEKRMIGRQINNRENMLGILDTLANIDSLKIFMRDINTLLNPSQKKSLVTLTKETQQLTQGKPESKPFELMFVYDPGLSDFKFGIRTIYEHYDPHTNVTGGTEPEALVAGTIDLVIKNGLVKIAKMRIDSGHFMPGPEALEYVMRYLKQEVNPAYYDEVVLHTYDGDNETPQLRFK